jgi:Holliday junction resolvasome RuvABC endonuclease subunit
VSRILSFDLSLTNSGWCVAVDGTIREHGLIPGKCDGVQRLIHNRNRICERIDGEHPDMVIFEDLAWSKNEAFAKENAGLAYMVRAELVTEKIPYIVAAANSLKKFCCGSGGSKKTPVKKEHVLKDLALRFGHNVDSNDVADAIVLAYIGMALMGEWEPKIAAQREVLETLRKNYPHLKQPVRVGRTPETVQTVQQSPSDGW